MAARLRIARLLSSGRLSAELADLIFTGKLQIRKLPKLTALSHLNHKKLLLVLRQCPESPIFGKEKEQVNTRTIIKKHALDLVRKVIVANITVHSLDRVSEANASKE